MIGSGVGRIISMVSSDDQKIILAKALKQHTQVHIEFLDLLCIA